MNKQTQEKVILFGGGKVGLSVCLHMKDRVIAVIDNDSKRWGELFVEEIFIISIHEYQKKYNGVHILISSSKYAEEIERQLRFYKIFNYSFAIELWQKEDVPLDEEIAHRNWPRYLKNLCDKPGMEVLELGSRRVNKEDKWNEYFRKSNYTGFDYYAGENVDVVGDAHQLSRYFNKKFDLIFSSAVFEHLAMPWKVSLEIIKLLNPGGYVFVETHYCYNSHERPWHFFQFSEQALNVLFPEKFGMKCLKKGCCNLLEGRFSEESSEYLQGKLVGGLYCHSEFLAKKIRDIPEKKLSWDNISLENVVGETRYPPEKGKNIRKTENEVEK